MNAVSLLVLGGALLIGLTLGLLGSGGSILAVPVLVYLVGQPEKVAVAGSLIIVGGIAAVGALNYLRLGRVSWRHVLWFGLPGMLGTWLGASLSARVSGDVQMLVFATVMMLAAVLMLRPPKISEEHRAAWRLSAQGVGVGVLTGLVGVGGGFLIVPALVIFGGLAMHEAVGTSLAIIALNAAAGFAKHVSVLAARGLELDWFVIGVFVAAGIAGSAAGISLAKRLPQHALRRIFAVCVLGIAAYIGWQTLPPMLRA